LCGTPETPVYRGFTRLTLPSIVTR
jgi:hypothetical protein